MTAKLSILIAVHNDSEEIVRTLESIRQTSPSDEVEVLVCDDASVDPVRIPVALGAVLYRRSTRAGCAPCRHALAMAASGTHILITDAHMRFEPGWYEKWKARVKDNPRAVYCGACLQLGYGNMDVTKPSGVYTGATILFYGNDPNVKLPFKQVFEGKWRDHKNNAELPCMMGACYFLPRDVFLSVGGLDLLAMWGTDEPYLSLKLWLAGFEIRLASEIRIGHQFRDDSTYRTGLPHLYLNKLKVFCTCMNEDECKRLITYMHGVVIDQGGPTAANDWSAATDSLRSMRGFILQRRDQYSMVFKHDLRWFCEKFGIVYP